VRRPALLVLPLAATAFAAAAFTFGTKGPRPARAGDLGRAVVHVRVRAHPRGKPRYRPPGTLIVHVTRPLALWARPNGTAIATVGTSTGFGSPQTLTVVRRGRRWLGVTSTALPNDRLGWIDLRSRGIRFSATRVSLEIDLSRQELRVRVGMRIVRRIRVGIGRAGTSTPTGRFAITDKLNGAAYSPVYGCCILALSGHQTNLPAGWTGGDRLAIHGGGLGAVSTGCLHASEADLRYLMRVVPLGSAVTIHP
jgi:hypothetical protein